MNAYDRLKGRFARIATLKEAESVLGWDAATMMPPGGGAARGDQLAVLAGLAHNLLTDECTTDDLAEASECQFDNAWDKQNLSLMRHAHRRAKALPTDLVEARERANSICEKVWRTARAGSDFAEVLPYLNEVVSLTRKAASALAPALGLEPYDSLMDQYQPGIGVGDVEPLFARYQLFLAEFLPAVEARQASSGDALPLAGVFSADQQERLCRNLSQRVGLEPTYSRLDRSTHPFCAGIPNDIRITTRYDEANPEMAVLGVLHETGHALYERGLPETFSRQPVGGAAGMAVHESQSLIIEMQACRSDQFLTWLCPELQRIFGGDTAPYTPQNLGKLWRKVERSLIRVDADEVTYPAHIILRFRLERALIGGDLKVAELPAAWAEQLQSLLGRTPPDDAHGCLQDIHWFDGAFGYFPSYTVGAMAAAQFMAAARQEDAGIDDTLRQGDFGSLTSWLHTRIHQMGHLYGFNDLLRSATGSSLNAAFFEDHLRGRYLDAAGAYAVTQL